VLGVLAGDKRRFGGALGIAFGPLLFVLDAARADAVETLAAALGDPRHLGVGGDEWHGGGDRAGGV